MAMISTEKFAKALEEAGVVHDLNTITRIVIDMRPVSLVQIHVQRVGDERLIDLAELLVDAATVGDEETFG